MVTKAAKRHVSRVLRALRRDYSDAECALHYETPVQLLVATILSAQCTDKRVNLVTRVLFRKYPTAAHLARVPLSRLEKDIQSTGFFRNKAKNLIAMAQLVVLNHAGEIPRTMAELVLLPGVARKTANVILGTFFGKNVGVVVDTHVGRISTRLDLTWTSKDTKDAVKIEKDLMEVLPRKDWTYFSHAVILHGRETCSARKPRCDDCTLARYCPSAGEIEV